MSRNIFITRYPFENIADLTGQRGMNSNKDKIPQVHPLRGVQLRESHKIVKRFYFKS
jgi:hypothetical protein